MPARLRALRRPQLEQAGHRLARRPLQHAPRHVLTPKRTHEEKTARRPIAERETIAPCVGKRHHGREDLRAARIDLHRQRLGQAAHASLGIGEQVRRRRPVALDVHQPNDSPAAHEIDAGAVIAQLRHRHGRAVNHARRAGSQFQLTDRHVDRKGHGSLRQRKGRNRPRLLDSLEIRAEGHA